MPTYRTPAAGIALLASAARGLGTASGADLVDPSLAIAETLLLVLEVTAVSGTTPTLDCEVQVKIAGKYTRLATFAQIGAAGVKLRKVNRYISVTSEGDLAADPALTAAGITEWEWLDTLRVKYTVGGTATPTVTFSVTAYPIH